MTVTPLNGVKTHPISAVATDSLRSVRNDPRPAQEINPGVINRLLRGDQHGAYIKLVDLPSPYRSHKDGRKISHAQITEAGINFLDGLT